MLVFRLTDDCVRRTRGKQMAPMLPDTIECEWESNKMDQVTMEWTVRYESYKEAIETQLTKQRETNREEEALFLDRIDRTIKEAESITQESLNQKKRIALVTCKSCKSDDIIKDERQVKSADEGATGFYTCQACGYSWKQAG